MRPMREDTGMPRPSLVRAVVMLLALVAAMALAGAPSPARADWDESDPAKWVQLPDETPEGMDVKL